MIDFIDVEVKNLEEAKTVGAAKLCTEADDVEIEMLEEVKKGLFGKKEYRVRVYRKQKVESSLEPEPSQELSKEGAAQPQKLSEGEAPAAKAQKNRVIGETSGDYGIYTFYEDGLYVLIPQPVAGEPPVEYLQAVEEITHLGFVSVDLDELASAVENPGTQKKIAPPQPKHLLVASHIKVEEPKGSYLLFDFRPDGIYAKALIKGSPLELTQVITDLEKRGLLDVDTEAVLKVVEGAPDYMKIASQPPQELLRDGSCTVSVTADGMKATVRVLPPFGGKPVTVEGVRSTLQKEGIAVEVEEERLKELVEAAQLHPAETILTGFPPQPGEDASFELLFSKEKKTTGPKELEDGRVDYRELGAVQNVHKGDVLVIKHPAGMGTPGMTVRGEEVPGKPGKDLPLPAGKNTEVSSDGLQLLAAIDGQPLAQGNKISVLPVFEVPGDVDLSVGNIDFVGNVIVRGSVLSGLTVKAQGDIEVFGNVEDALLDSKGNIKIRGGVSGHGKAIIKASQDIAVRFGENAKFIAGGNIKVGEALMHCMVSCGKKVDVAGRKGLLVGGEIKAAEEVSARIVGNKFATQTVLEVGIDPALREELQKLRKEIEQEQENLQKTQKALETLKAVQKSAGSLPPDKAELILKLTRTQFQLMAQLKSMVARRQELDELTKKKAGGKVSVSDVIYSGVSITIGNANLMTKDEMKFVTLVEKDGEIHQSSYRK